MRSHPAVSVLAFLWSFASAAPAASGGGGGGTLPSAPDATRARLGEAIRAASVESLIATGRQAVRDLGRYRARVVKQERVDGKLLAPQTIQLAVCPAPRALRLEFVAGPSSGRKLVWRAAERPAEMLVREGGLLGLASVWIDVNGKLARRDTNHPVTEIGFGPLLDIFESDVRKAHPLGGHRRRDLGFDARDRYCIEYAAPPGATGLYAERTVICLEPRRVLPVRIEVFDRQGLREQYEYDDIRPNQDLAPSLFDEV